MSSYAPHLLVLLTSWSCILTRQGLPQVTSTSASSQSFQLPTTSQSSRVKGVTLPACGSLGGHQIVSPVYQDHKPLPTGVFLLCILFSICYGLMSTEHSGMHSSVLWPLSGCSLALRAISSSGSASVHTCEHFRNHLLLHGASVQTGPNFYVMQDQG